MFTKEQIFKDIQEILQNDYAGFLDYTHLNHPEHYRISNNMSDRAFEETIQDYLLDFHDGHLWFASKNSELPHVGFSVRRYEDALYVTESPQEKRLTIGDKIVQIDGEDIRKLARRYRKRLEDDIPERQRWNSVIRRSKGIQVEKDGETLEILLADYESQPYQAQHIFTLLDNETAYIQITDFAEEKPIQKLMSENRAALAEVENLIIDVRVNHGGNDAFYFPLLHHIFNRTLSFPELFAEDEVMYTNYTERNCQFWIQELKEYLKQELDNRTIESIEKEIDLFEGNYGKGLLEVPEDTEFIINGCSNPAHVYVLSDFYCGSSGDTFVSNVKNPQR